MKTIIKVPLLLSLATVVWATGCQQTSQQRRHRAAVTPVPTPAPAATRESCTDPTRGLVSLAKHMPHEVMLGETFEYQLVLHAQDCVDNVIVTDLVPSGASYVKSEPAAQVAGDRLTWRLKPMEPDQSETLSVWLKAEQEGTLNSCATISADPRVCATTFVGKPVLSIKKTGPESAIITSNVNYTIVVANNGSTVARNVVVTDTVPDGLASEDGNKQLTYQVGDLNPTESKTITVSLKAMARGEHCNTAVATADNTEKVSAEACTTVLQHGLGIGKTGTTEQFLGRKATYEIVLRNTGDTTLTGVVVTDVAPDETKVVDAGGGALNGNTITWNVGDLAKGDSRTFKVLLTSMTPGNHCNNVSVTSDQGLKDSAEACTDWKGVSGLLLEKGDHPDPIQVGEETTYYVRVTNQGTAPDADIKIVVQFPSELSPVSADNDGQVQGQTVTFPPYPQLDPKQSFEYHITAKGVAAGDARVKFIRTSRDIPAPTTAEESTRVY